MKIRKKCGFYWWQVIDEITQGGFGKGELILFAAPPALVNRGP